MQFFIIHFLDCNLVNRLRDFLLCFASLSLFFSCSALVEFQFVAEFSSLASLAQHISIVVVVVFRSETKTKRTGLLHLVQIFGGELECVPKHWQKFVTKINFLHDTHWAVSHCLSIYLSVGSDDESFIRCVLTYAVDRCDHSPQQYIAIVMRTQPNSIDRYFSQFCHFSHRLQWLLVSIVLLVGPNYLRSLCPTPTAHPAKEERKKIIWNEIGLLLLFLSKQSIFSK